MMQYCESPNYLGFNRFGYLAPFMNRLVFMFLKLKKKYEKETRLNNCAANVPALAQTNQGHKYRELSGNE